MTPQELKDLALKSAQGEADKVEAQLQEAAQKGHFSVELRGLSEGVMKHLKDKGFTITPSPFNVMPGTSIANKMYTVSFN